MTQELEAVFYFNGDGLYITGDALGKSAEFETNGTRITLNLPKHDEVFALADPGWPGERKAARPTFQNGEGKMLAGVILKFEVRVAVSGTTEEATSDLVASAFPTAVETAERFLGLARTRANQDWLPSRQEGASLALYGMLMYAGTDTEVKQEARWQPPGLAVGINPERAAGPDEIEQLLLLTRSGTEPLDADVLLADARAAISIVRVRQQWKAEHRDTGRAVLLAGMAAELKIKRTLTEKIRPELRPLLDVILENPRDMSIATGQLLDKPMKAALGISLREEKANLPDEYETLFRTSMRSSFPGETPSRTAGSRRRSMRRRRLSISPDACSHGLTPCPALLGTARIPTNLCSRLAHVSVLGPTRSSESIAETAERLERANACTAGIPAWEPEPAG
jgi:hypothetical protein